MSKATSDMIGGGGFPLAPACVVLTGLAGFFASSPACVDPCLLTGGACNVSSDCREGQVCLHAAPDDLSCPVVKGVCGEGACGSDDDCDFGCCDLVERVCVLSSFDCASRACTEAFASSVEEGGCEEGLECNDGACLLACEDDFDCPGSARCFAGRCTAQLGDRCNPDHDDCHAASDCIDLDLAGEPTEPYCTVTCFEFDSDTSKTRCEAGYRCDADNNECRREP